MPGKTTSQLRDDIDSGRTGEKVPYGDPAAAPLGTDDEAGGRAPSEAEREIAASTEPQGESSLEAPAVTEERSRPDLGSSAPGGVRPLLALLVALAIATLIAALVFL